MTVRPYLDYYIENKIIPVEQDLSDLALHLKRRSLLYYYLGIPPTAVRNRRVLEIGPGTGDNAVHTASLGPHTYVFVDGNPYSLNAVKKRCANPRYFLADVPNLKLIETDFLLFNDEDRYDLVLSEGLVPGQKDSKAFLRHVSSFADRDGLIVTTTISATSLLAEICRRLIKPLLGARAKTSEQLFEQLETLFEPHLQTLPGRSRSAGDWVRDSILQPYPREFVFTIADAVDAIGKEFDLYASSPRFIQDFRWYKAAAVDGRTLNAVAIEQISLWSPLFIDYRLEPGDIGRVDGIELEDKSLDILTRVHEAWVSHDIDMVRECVERIAEFGDGISRTIPRTAASIKDFVAGMKSLLAGQPSHFGDFSSWFGRGQQYISFLRRNQT